MPRNCGPWCCMGDFNEINSITEKDGCRPIAPIGLTLFRNFLNATGLMDLDLKGCKYTWNNNSIDGILLSRRLIELLLIGVGETFSLVLLEWLYLSSTLITPLSSPP